MNIAFMYDDQIDYNLENVDVYKDFCLTAEAHLISQCLKNMGHKVDIVKGMPNILAYLFSNKPDLVFNKFEGFSSRNREGLLPSLLETFHLPYTGTDSYGFNLSLNKFHTKLIAQYYSVLTPDFQIYQGNPEIFGDLTFSGPYIVKPNNEGSSIGVTLVSEKSDLFAVCEALYQEYSQSIIIEKYIAGVDISVPIIADGTDAMPMGIVKFLNEDGSVPQIATTDFKYKSNYITHYLTDHPFKSNIERDAMQIFHALGCHDFARIDFRLANDKYYFLEINPLPTLCEHGAFHICALHSNKDMHDVIRQIIISASKRYNL